MKLIEVEAWGEDFGAMTFEESGISINEIYEDMRNNGTTKTTKEIDEIEINFKLLEFQEVDPKFISYIKHNYCDYDALKAKDFYIIEE